MNGPSESTALLTAKQLAGRWGCTEASLAHIRMKPYDPATGPRWIKCGNRVRYYLADIEEHEQREWAR